MGRIIDIFENGIYVVIEVTEQKDVRLIHLSPAEFNEKMIRSGKQEKWFRLVELQVTGEDQDDHHGAKHTGTMPGHRLTYLLHRDYINDFGRKLEVIMEDCGKLTVISHIQFFKNMPVIRTWTEVKNIGNVDIGLDYVSTFALTGIQKQGLSRWDKKSRIHIPHNTWHGECQWKAYTLPELGLNSVHDNFSLKRFQIGNTGTWSSCGYLPMGAYENVEAGTILFWQIEHNGSWSWEISDISENLYLQVSGPSENENHWWKRLEPNKSFCSVPASICCISGSLEQALQEITRYRRIIRRKNSDNEMLPVIFNDYMNCLFGDPSSEKLIPIINAAAEVGCEYFCIDAGWYDDTLEGALSWWGSVGLWKPSQKRFPEGLENILGYIRQKGMVPGLWIEIEVMGVNCPGAAELPDNWFFVRHGKRIIDHGRYQLDFRNPQVTAYADEVIDRLIREYGVGYIKMDYNINAGIGTEIDADSFGEGLIQHNRAYLSWLDRVFERYPELVIENCGSGGMRMDYAMLSKHSIQSTSDQTDYKKYAYIAASAPSALTPEQSAIWSYPLVDGDCEEVVFNMINAMLMRIHQSGHLAMISKERLEYVNEGLRYYRNLRGDIPSSLPFWPLGLPSFGDEWTSLGLRNEGKAYLAVWRLQSSEDAISMPMNFLKGKEVEIKCAFPEKGICDWKWNMQSGILTVKLPQNFCARLFEMLF